LTPGSHENKLQTTKGTGNPLQGCPTCSPEGHIKGRKKLCYPGVSGSPVLPDGKETKLTPSPMKHLLFSQNQDMPVVLFDQFDAQAIKQAIVEHLKADPTDTIEHCKEYNRSDARRFYGHEIISFYACDRFGKPCKVITKGDKNYFKPLN
jgi:hypothetical protein